MRNANQDREAYPDIILAPKNADVLVKLHCKSNTTCHQIAPLGVGFFCDQLAINMTLLTELKAAATRQKSDGAVTIFVHFHKGNRTIKQYNFNIQDADSGSFSAVTVYRIPFNTVYCIPFQPGTRNPKLPQAWSFPRTRETRIRQ
jgi:hypothetical protein